MALYTSAVYADDYCLSVCLSVTLKTQLSSSQCRMVSKDSISPCVIWKSLKLISADWNLSFQILYTEKIPEHVSLDLQL